MMAVQAVEGKCRNTLDGNFLREGTAYTVEPLITNTAGEFKFCPLQEVYVSWSSSSDLCGTVWRRFGE